MFLFSGRATDDVQNTRAVTLLLDVACSWPLELILPFFSGRVLRPNDFARYTYAVALFFIFFLWSLCLGFFFTGAGMDIIFKDLEAETIHVCIAWALLNILGCFLLLCYLLSSFTDCFSVHGIWGLVNNTSLPLVCGWLGLVAKPWDAELFLFELDILGGLSRCASLDHYALKMLSFLLSFPSLLLAVYSFYSLGGLPESYDLVWCWFTLILAHYQVRSHLLFVSSWDSSEISTL